MNQQPVSQQRPKRKLCFVHPGKSGLPELAAYRQYFGDRYEISERSAGADLSGFDILWFIMGFYRYQAAAGQFVIHEYSSLSVPPLARLKDIIKRYAETTPNLRIFQNRQQQLLMPFQDNVPYAIRDMGVAAEFFTRTPQPKKFDVVYVGSMDKTRRIDEALDRLLQLKTDISVLMIGAAPEWLRRRYAHRPGICFAGVVEHQRVVGLLQQARFGLNFIPRCYPYDLQTSTKLLEYLAAGLPVIGNMTTWCRHFLQQHPVSYFEIDQLSQLPTDESYGGRGKVTLSEHFLWHNRIAQAGIDRYLPG